MGSVVSEAVERMQQRIEKIDEEVKQLEARNTEYEVNPTNILVDYCAQQLRVRGGLMQLMLSDDGVDATSAEVYFRRVEHIADVAEFIGPDECLAMYRELRLMFAQNVLRDESLVDQLKEYYRTAGRSDLIESAQVSNKALIVELVAKREMLVESIAHCLGPVAEYEQQQEMLDDVKVIEAGNVKRDLEAAQLPAASNEVSEVVRKGRGL